MYVKTLVKCRHYNRDTTFGKLFPLALYEALIHGFPDQKHSNREHKKESVGYKIIRMNLLLNEKSNVCGSFCHCEEP